MSALAPVLVRWGLLLVVATALLGYGYHLGVARESDRRDALELAQRKDDDKLYALAQQAGATAVRTSMAERQKAAGYYAQLQRSIRDAQPETLTVLGPQQAPAPGGAAAPAFAGPDAKDAAAPALAGPVQPDAAQPGAPGLRLTVLFSPDWVRFYNAAWAGAGTAADPGRALADAAGAGAADPQEILEHTASEAQACGDDRRRYANLIRLLRSPPYAALLGTPLPGGP